MLPGKRLPRVAPYSVIDLDSNDWNDNKDLLRARPSKESRNWTAPALPKVSSQVARASTTIRFANLGRKRRLEKLINARNKSLLTCATHVREFALSSDVSVDSNNAVVVLSGTSSSEEGATSDDDRSLISPDPNTYKQRADDSSNEDGEISDGDRSEGRGDVSEEDTRGQPLLSRKKYLKRIVQCAREVAASAAGMPSDEGYIVQSCYNSCVTDLLKRTSGQILSSMYALFQHTAPHVLKESGVKDAASLGESPDVITSCLDVFLLKAGDGIDVAKEAGCNAPMEEYLTRKMDEERNTRLDKLRLSALFAENAATTRRKRRRLNNSHEKADTSSAGQKTSQHSTDPWKRDIRVLEILGRFVPLLRQKWHAIAPLDQDIADAQMEREQIIMALSKGQVPHNMVESVPLAHPYLAEITSLDWQNKAKPEGKLHLLRLQRPVGVKPFSSTPFELIETEAGLTRMIDLIESQGCKEIAIDVEHHSHPSYLGMTCLIQLSTRERDYIIDPMDLKDELDELNRLTANPGILKVLHGSRNDVIWLQRDFGIYLVNVFDTAEAARLLRVPGGFSLKNLLEFYCNVLDVDKQYQLADWRIRPLPEAMQRYARTDTHYLLYLKDRLRNELLLRPKPALISETAGGELLPAVLPLSSSGEAENSSSATVSVLRADNSESIEGLKGTNYGKSLMIQVLRKSSLGLAAQVFEYRRKVTFDDTAYAPSPHGEHSSTMGATSPLEFFSNSSGSGSGQVARRAPQVLHCLTAVKKYFESNNTMQQRMANACTQTTWDKVPLPRVIISVGCAVLLPKEQAIAV